MNEETAEPNPRPEETQARPLDNGATGDRGVTPEDFPGGLSACLEAILMTADQPQPSADLATVLGVSEKRVESCLGSLSDQIDREGHGYQLRRTARGWMYASRPDFQPVVSAFVTAGQSAHLSQAALESLAIIAYRQPITRAQVAGIRGVNSDGVIRSLLVRGLVREDGVDPESRAALLVTTALFLEHMDIASVDELPSLAPFLPDESTAVREMKQQPSPVRPAVRTTDGGAE
ncbi:SMC-Scp complex subunit ScpB [Bifidobacterium xylocopae]|uniref:SMC-Scp complex subunit ScpB n=1 Tax=Bifidobacterium xylocopae TaxID=2493119 RepID=A0A366KAK9_9BIFI|nr:SMC-Scp complex subunit ScpB [Bifidobacterium xylocopae]RBP98775.1 SMC-Scp complex subunit ScpB [Bifidobacterium xylocopae]